MKAGFIVSFRDYISWPESPVDTDERFLIGVIGDERFATHLKLAVNHRKWSIDKVKVMRFKSVEDVEYVHFLFVGELEENETKDLIKKCEALDIFTVGDHQGFLDLGGGIELVDTKKRVRFKINKDLARRMSIQISSRLARLAANS